MTKDKTESRRKMNPDSINRKEDADSQFGVNAGESLRSLEKTE